MPISLIGFDDSIIMVRVIDECRHARVGDEQNKVHL